MSQLNENQIQVLRTMDKFDKIGGEGVITLLQKSPSDFGANLDPVNAGLIGIFLNSLGKNNEETINNILNFFDKARMVNSRLDLMAQLDSNVVDEEGTTSWDRLLNMPVNVDETWDNGGRPANIGWALDDLISELSKLNN